MSQTFDVKIPCGGCGATGYHSSAANGSGSVACHLCDATGFQVAGQITIDPGLDDIMDKLNDIMDKLNDIMDKLNDILSELQP